MPRGSKRLQNLASRSDEGRFGLLLNENAAMSVSVGGHVRREALSTGSACLDCKVTSALLAS